MSSFFLPSFAAGFVSVKIERPCLVIIPLELRLEIIKGEFVYLICMQSRTVSNE